MTGEQKIWLDENAAAFAAQSEWHRRNPHPAAKIMVLPDESMRDRWLKPAKTSQK